MSSHREYIVTVGRVHARHEPLVKGSTTWHDPTVSPRQPGDAKVGDDPTITSTVEPAHDAGDEAGYDAGDEPAHDAGEDGRIEPTVWNCSNARRAACEYAGNTRIKRKLESDVNPDESIDPFRPSGPAPNATPVPSPTTVPKRAKVGVLSSPRGTHRPLEGRIDDSSGVVFQSSTPSRFVRCSPHATTESIEIEITPDRAQLTDSAQSIDVSPSFNATFYELSRGDLGGTPFQQWVSHLTPNNALNQTPALSSGRISRTSSMRHTSAPHMSVPYTSAPNVNADTTAQSSSTVEATRADHHRKPVRGAQRLLFA